MSSYDHFTSSLGDDSGDDEQTETLSSRRDLEKKDRSELIADIQEMAEQLILRTEILQPPFREEYGLHFYPQESDKIGYLPPGLSMNIGKTGTIQQIIVTGHVNQSELRSQLTVAFAIQTPNGDTFVVDCKPDGDATRTLIITPHDTEPLTGIDFPANELKRMFASIFAKNKTGDYSTFDKLDFEEFDVTTNIILALVKHADFTTYEAAMRLKAQASHDEVTFEYTRTNGTLDDIFITRHHSSGTTTTYGAGLTAPLIVEAGDEMYYEDGFGYSHLPEGADKQLYSNGNEQLVELHEFIQGMKNAVPYYSALTMPVHELEEAEGGRDDTYPSL